MLFRTVQRRNHYFIIRMNKESQRLSRKTPLNFFFWNSNAMNLKFKFQYKNHFLHLQKLSYSCEITVRCPELHQVSDVYQNCSRYRRSSYPFTSRKHLYGQKYTYYIVDCLFSICLLPVHQYHLERAR